MPDGTGADVGLSDGLHLNGGLNTDIHFLALQHIRHGQGIDDRGQHPHVVSTDSLHIIAAVLLAPPEVAAAYHNAHLDAQLGTFFDGIGHFVNHIKVQAAPFVASQGFSADLQ